MKGEDVLVRGSYKFHVRKYHAQPKFANDTTKQCIDEYTNNNSNLGGKTLKGRTFHLLQPGGDWAEPQPAQAPPRCTKRNSPPINGQCTNFVLFHVAL